MNDSLLRQIYNGELYPAEDMGKFISPEERRRGHKIEKEVEYFEKALSSEDWARFSKLDALQRDSSSEYAFENFTFGFRLGVMLMAEVLANGQELIQ